LILKSILKNQIFFYYFKLSFSKFAKDSQNTQTKPIKIYMRYKKCCWAKKKYSNRKRKYKNPPKKYVPFPPRVRTRPAADASARTWAGCASSGLSLAGRRWRIQGVGGRRAGWRGCPGLTWARWGPRSGGQSRVWARKKERERECLLFLSIEESWANQRA
jgi:hypothetical protein